VAFNDLRIGIRMGAGFGLLILMMLVMTLVSVMRFGDVAEINDRIIEKDWVKAEAANVINATTRANARRTMELVIAADPQQITGIKQHIETNKKTISAALDTLESLIYLPEGKALVARLKEARGKYVASFSKVAKLVDEGKRDEAITVLNAETLPALDALQEPINALNELQRKIVVASSAELRAKTASARTLLLVLGILGLVLGAGFSYWLTVSVTRPLHEAVHMAKTVASGDLTVQVGGVRIPRMKSGNC